MKTIRVFPIVAVVCLSVILIDRWVSYKLDLLKHARTVFIDSVQDSRSRLTSSLWNLATSPDASNHIRVGEWNAMTSLLDAQIRPGELTQLELVDGSCQLLARAPHRAKPLANLCQPGQSFSSKLKWSEGVGEGAVLSLAVPVNIAGQTTLYIMGHVVFDEVWTATYPKLSFLEKSGLIDIGARVPTGAIWREGYLGVSGVNQPKAVLLLSVGGWLGTLLPDLSRLSLNSYMDMTWMICIFLLVFSGLAYSESIVSKREELYDRNKALDWMHSKSEIIGINDDQIQRIDSSKWAQIFESLANSSSDKLEKLKSQLKLQKERHDQMTLSAISRERKVAELKDELASMSDLRSLKEQLLHSTESFLNKMQEVRDNCENMFDLCSEGLSKQTKSIQEFIAEWKNGIDDKSHRERGARKFFRTLSETQGRTKHTTLLDDQLIDLEKYASGLLDQTLHLAIMTRQALNDVGAGVHLAGLWHGLALRESQRDKTVDWTSCLASAQAMVVSEKKFESLNFEMIPVTQSPGEFYPSVSRIALISGMFHLYMALLSDAIVEDISSPIIVRQKQVKSRGTLIFSLPNPLNEDSDQFEDGHNHREYHMDLAKALLAPIGVQTAFLPPTMAGVPVVLTWDIPSQKMSSPKPSESVGQDGVDFA
jgi:hypothetical protein